MQDFQKRCNAGIIKDTILHRAIKAYNTYEEYLDSMIIKEDLFYLEVSAYFIITGIYIENETILRHTNIGLIGLFCIQLLIILLIGSITKI